jgi:hypothetical protein
MPPWIPRDNPTVVDAREFAQARQDVEHERRHLERQLDLHVAAYDRSAKPTRNGLCSVYQVASLSGLQLRSLQQAEARLVGVAFVAYAKPLRRREGDV